jgi:hypothetical protein
MNKVLITSGGHSCSGYVFEDGSKPYTSIEKPSEVDCWLDGIRRSEVCRRDWKSGRNPRDMAIEICSYGKAVENWKRVVNLLGAENKDA